MPFTRFRTARREARFSESAPSASRLKAPPRQWAIWIIPGLFVIALHLVLFPPIRSVERIALEVGQITDQEIRAPFRFRAPRAVAELEEARRAASQRVEPVYLRDDAARRRSEQGLEDFLARAAELAAMDSVSTAQRVENLRSYYGGLETSTLRSVLDPQRLEALRGSVVEVAQGLLQAGIVDTTPRGTYQFLRVRDSGEDPQYERVAVTDVVFGYQLDEQLRRSFRERLGEPAAARAATEIALYFLLSNLEYDDAETESLRAAALEAVPAEREYARNERILESGARVTRDALAVLEAMEQERVARAVASDSSIQLRIRAGRIVLLALVLVATVLLIRQIDPRMPWQTHRYLLLNMLWALFLGLSALVLRNAAWGGPPAVPIALLAMLAVVIYGEAAAYRVAAGGALLLLIMPEHASPLALVWAAVAVSSVRMLRRVRNRNQFYRALGAVAATAFVTTLAVEFGDAAGVREAIVSASHAVGAVAVCTALTLFLLPLFEAAFGVTTELTLLELSDLNHPLLKRMSLESPGTFHHSQVVGTLAEAGARSIGANSLLTRVGSNFHDIGKMLKPRYFAENQGVGNPHDELTPQMSALVIASHVKEGIELGRQWGIPESVLAFIPEHHGTSVMQFFYKKALDGEDKGAVKVDDFRYPGPKPRSKETAILMLADGAEASVRSLRRPTASRVREMVRKIIDGKMAEGELEECGLTLRELAAIREAFIPILVGIHHQRVAYPGQREHEEKKEKESREARSRARRSGASVGSGS